MPDETQPPILSPELATELETLRRTNLELVAKGATRKQRIAELELTVTELQGRLSEANDTVHQVTIDGPLKAMAESISITPELFLEQFNKSYRLEMMKGVLTLLSIDGKPVMNGEKPTPFEREALTKLLTSDAHPQAKIYNSILIASRASGASNPSANERDRRSAAKAKPTIQFGLR